MEKQKDEMARKFSIELRGLSDTQLMALLVKKENEGYNFAASVIRDEMDRRGISY